MRPPTGSVFVMKRLAISIIASLVVGLTAPATAQQLTFHYGFIGQHDDQQLYVIEDRADLASGSKLKLNFEYPTGSWFYVCYLSSTDEHALLYASNTGLDANEQTIFDAVGWLALDENIGTETFTLIASERRLEKLETLFNNYSKASDKSRKRFAKTHHPRVWGSSETAGRNRAFPDRLDTDDSIPRSWVELPSEGLRARRSLSTA